MTAPGPSGGTEPICPLKGNLEKPVTLRVESFVNEADFRCSIAKSVRSEEAERACPSAGANLLLLVCS